MKNNESYYSTGDSKFRRSFSKVFHKMDFLKIPKNAKGNISAIVHI